MLVARLALAGVQRCLQCGILLTRGVQFFFALSTTIMHLQGAEYRIFCVILLHASDALVKL